MMKHTVMMLLHTYTHIYSRYICRLLGFIVGVGNMEILSHCFNLICTRELVRLKVCEADMYSSIIVVVYL